MKSQAIIRHETPADIEAIMAVTFYEAFHATGWDGEKGESQGDR